MSPRTPESLSLHPFRAGLPAPDFKSRAWISFRDNLHAAGPDAVPPVVITEDGQVMAGVRTWLAAQQLGWPTLRTEVQPDWMAPLLFVEGLMGQRDMTRGAKVYLVRLKLADYVRASDRRRLANLRAGRTTREVEILVPTAREEAENDEKAQCFPMGSNSTSGTIGALCERLGVDRSVWSRAGKVIALFAADPEAKQVYEPQLLDGTKNLWNVISGTEGADATKGQERPTNSATQMELFDDAMEPLLKAVQPWEKLPPQFRNLILGKWRDAVAQMPADAREALAAILTEEMTA